jgi:hypothetical protein
VNRVGSQVQSENRRRDVRGGDDLREADDRRARATSAGSFGCIFNFQSSVSQIRRHQEINQPMVPARLHRPVRANQAPFAEGCGAGSMQWGNFAARLA